MNSAIISNEQFRKLFPFYFVIDQKFLVSEIGSVLARICPEMLVGKPIQDFFKLVRVGQAFVDEEFLLKQASSLIIFESLKSKLFLRMQVLILDNPRRFLFLGSPWLRESSELKELGIVLPDFAIHDSTVDLLQMHQSQAISLRDAIDINAKLELMNMKLEQRVADQTSKLSIANEELMRMMRSKDEFLSSMSHELRTPLNAILGLSESLSENVYGELNEKQTKSIHTIAESGHHLLSLINDLLDIAKIGAGKMELDWSISDVEEVCSSSLRIVTNLAAKKNLRISMKIDPRASAINADQRRLKQILVNLLSNAVKFTQEDGSVALEIHCDSVRNVMEFSVIDTGIGIEQEDLKSIFIPFTQLDSKLSRQYSGTGLGLSLVKRLTELHGGTVEVKSEVGVGSTFTFSLPWIPIKTQWKNDLGDLNPDQREQAYQYSHLILIADDNESNLSTVGDYLQANNFGVVKARNGIEAINAATKQKPDLILMDILMPAMDGIRAIAHLRSDPTYSTIPIIALTSRAMVGDRERCLSIGANDYLSKPVNLKQLVQNIRSHLNEINNRLT